MSSWPASPYILIAMPVAFHVIVAIITVHGIALTPTIHVIVAGVPVHLVGASEHAIGVSQVQVEQGHLANDGTIGRINAGHAPA